jgi:hypothetical protein
MFLVAFPERLPVKCHSPTANRNILDVLSVMKIMVVRRRNFRAPDSPLLFLRTRCALLFRATDCLDEYTQPEPFALAVQAVSPDYVTDPVQKG